MEVLNEVAVVLGEYVDTMLDALPKELPSHQAINHKIELEPRTRPLTKALYKMSYSELVELRKQLNELLDVGFVKPSKA